MTPERETENDRLRRRIRELEDLIKSESGKSQGQLGYGYLLACHEQMKRTLEWAEKNME